MVCLLKTIKNLLGRWKEFFEIKLNNDAPFVAFPDIADSLVVPYVCNREPPTEEEITSLIDKLKVNKIPMVFEPNSSNVIHHRSHNLSSTNAYSLV